MQASAAFYFHIQLFRKTKKHLHSSIVDISLSGNGRKGESHFLSPPLQMKRKLYCCALFFFLKYMITLRRFLVCYYRQTISHGA
jgi:hypothetical protein